MAGFKVCLNYILWRVGLWRVLPGAIINRVAVRECGEALVSYKGARLRVGVVERLKFAESRLPSGVEIKILSGFRSLSEQQKLWDCAPDRRLVANPANGGGGHQTGGAVDVTLCGADGRELDIGGKYLVFDALTKTAAVQNENRKLLCRVMADAGFVNYPNEWWHFSYGDKMWAAYARKKYAIYGSGGLE